MNKKRKAPVGVGAPSEAMFESGNGEITSDYQYNTSRDGCATTRYGGK